MGKQLDSLQLLALGKPEIWIFTIAILTIYNHKLKKKKKKKKKKKLYYGMEQILEENPL